MLQKESPSLFRLKNIHLCVYCISLFHSPINELVPLSHTTIVNKATVNMMYKYLRSLFLLAVVMVEGCIFRSRKTES